MTATVSVLHVEQPTGGGVRRYVLDLAKAQAEAGSRVGIAAPDMRRAAPGVDVLGWSARRSPGRSVVDEVRRLRHVISGWQPDIVHLHSSKAGLCGRLALRGRLPTIFQPHAWSFDALTGPMRVVAAKWEGVGARWTDVIVCVSEGERRAGAVLGQEHDLRVVPNGVDLDHWAPPGENERDAARERLGLGPGPLAICVGRLSRQKGQDVLIASWPGVRARVPDATLLLVGAGPDRARLAASAGPGIRFVGDVDDARPWLIASDVVVAPSRWEGMSLALLEGMACARSVVATDVNGTEETVGRGAGTIVSKTDTDRLTTAVVERLIDPVRARGEGEVGRALVEKHHDWRVVVGSIGNIYDEVLTRL